MKKASVATLIAALIAAPASLQAQHAGEPVMELVASQAKSAPSIDGIADESIWAHATALVTHDPLAQVDLTIKAVYVGDRIYFLAVFPDGDENRAHKTQVWVPDQERYRIGSDREDTFVFKWSMVPGPVDLRVDADMPYKADIWFWKANRTDPMGYADDKMHIYSPVEGPNSKSIVSSRGLRFFLERPADSGVSAYKTNVYPEFKGDDLPLYSPRQPEGSRADIRAKGVWRDGVWTVEFSRQLVTGNSDDIQFDLDQVYRFGVSRYEIAARKRNPELDQPFYGAGEITEPLALKFERPAIAKR